MKRSVVIAAILLFGFYLAAEHWITLKAEFGVTMDACLLGLGLYFIGKAIFIGAQLIVSGMRS